MIAGFRYGSQVRDRPQMSYSELEHETAERRGMPRFACICLAIGAKRIAPLWLVLAGIGEDDWHDAIDTDGAQAAEHGNRGYLRIVRTPGPRGHLLLNASLDSSGDQRQDRPSRATSSTNRRET